MTPNVRTHELKPTVRAVFSGHRVRLIFVPMSNQMHGFLTMGRVNNLFEYAHKTVNHSGRQYVVGAVHTNTIEGF